MEFIKLNIQLFAITKEATNSSLKSDAGNRATIYVRFTERDLTSENINNNTTTIDLEGTYTQNTGSWAQISSPMFYLEWYDDKRATWTEIASKNVTAMSRYDVVTLTGTINVPHKDNGTLTGQARVRWVYEKSSTLVPRNGNATTESTVLTQVPRETKFSSVTDAYIEENPTIKLNKQNPNATTTITWSCSGNGTSRSGTVVEKTSATEITNWTIPTSVYSCISSTGKSVTIYLTATTYNGSSALSQTSSTSFTATVKKERNLPDVLITAKDINTATKNLTGNENVVVLNASTIECTYSATAKNGATISSADINGTGLTVGTATISGSEPISKPTTNVFKLTATDSRGFPNSKSDTKDYIPYFVPTLNATIERNTPTDGLVNIAFSGTYFSGNFSSSNKNELTVEYRYAEKGSSLPDWTAIEPYKSGNNFSNNGAIQLSGFDYQKAYTVQLKVSDKLNSKTISQDIPVGRPSPWWDEENMYVDGDYYSRNSSGVLEKIPTKNEVVESAYLGQNPDINSLHYKNGIYGIYGCSQAPSMEIGTLEVLVYSIDWVIQRFSNPYGSVWQRQFTAGATWSEWSQLVSKIVLKSVWLRGGESVELTNTKRFLDIYFTINFGWQVGYGKYTIDTEANSNPEAFGSGIIQCFDTANGIEYYISECKFKDGVLTHTKTGYVNVSTGVFSERNGNGGYAVYRVETYD